MFLASLLHYWDVFIFYCQIYFLIYSPTIDNAMVELAHANSNFFIVEILKENL